jgi:putative Holliday junction resolvase
MADYIRILGLDIGDVRIGVALSDPLGLTAQPVESYTRRSLQEDIAHLSALVAEHQVHRVVAGMPRKMSGEVGEQGEKTIAFCQALSEAIPVPIVYQDERLSTKTARQTLIDGGVRRKKRKDVVDKVAAVVILQNYLDTQR